MKDVVRQLEGVRRTGRVLLLARWAMQWLAGLLAGFVLLSIIDYVLRLPGQVRFILAVITAGFAIVWMTRRVLASLSFNPDLTALALRAERLFPQVAGALASGVEFSAQSAAYAAQPRTSQLTQLSLARLEEQLAGVSLHKMVRLRPVVHSAILAILAFLGIASILLTAPQTSLIAIKRWCLPLGETQWPRRTELVSLVGQRVWPIDTPLDLRVRVDRGFSEGMRVWVKYRRIEPDGRSGSWQTPVLMNLQPDAEGEGRVRTKTRTFVGLIDPATLAPQHAQNSGVSGTTGAGGAVEIYFTDDEDETAVQTIQLVDRPSLRALTIETEPPAYARGLVNPQEMNWDPQKMSGSQVMTVTALSGSVVHFRLGLNRALPLEQLAAAVLFPGVADAKAVTIDTSGLRTTSTSAPWPQVTASFALQQSIQTPIHLVDENGLTDQAERVYRLEALEDRAPAAAVAQPVADEQVLATAIVALQGVGQDDVGVEVVELQAQTMRQAPTTTEPPLVPLSKESGRATRIETRHTLDLVSLQLAPGDQVDVYALARDVFDLDGRKHDPVRSAPRKLRIIDEPTLVGQIRTEMASLRQQAARLDEQQRVLFERAADQAIAPQQQLSNLIESKDNIVAALKGRMERNRLAKEHAEALQQALDKSSQLLQEAVSHSRAAGAKLEEAHKTSAAQQSAKRAEARESQDAVSKKLGELVELLDQGRDALALQLQTQRLLQLQQDLANQTRQTMAQTLGQSQDQMSPADKQKVQELGDKQAGLQDQAQALIRQLSMAAEAVSKQSQSPQEQATAQALANAAKTAQSKGLNQTMQKSANEIKQNKLASANQEQNQSTSTLRDMLAQMNNQEQIKKDMLKRQLLQLAEAISKLIERQKAEIGRLEKAEPAATLEPVQETLRRNTMATQEQARAAKQTAPAAEDLGQAAGYQGEAVTALRGAQRQTAHDAESQAVTALQAALAKVQKLQSESQENDAAKQRAELKTAYLDLAKRQTDLRTKTAAVPTAERLTREQRRQLTDLGHQEADIQVAAGDLRQKAGNSLVFQHLHNQIDENAGTAAKELRSGEGGESVDQKQAMVVQALSDMALALDQQNPQNRPFDSDSGNQNPGGGGGGGGPPPLVPPLAELRLIRSSQQHVYDATKALDTIDPARMNAEVKAREAIRLSAQQRELAGVAAQLVEQMTQTMQGPPSPTDSPKE